MIIPLYPRFIATSVGAGVPRGSPCPPATTGAESPIPSRLSTYTDRPRPPRTYHPARSEARTGARWYTTLTQPPENPRKNHDLPSSTSIVTRLSQGFAPETGHAPPSRAQTCPRSAVRHERLAMQIPADRRSGSHIHARDPSAFSQPRPRARNTFATNGYIPLLHDISIIQTTDRPDGMAAYVVFGDGEPCARVAETGNGNPQLLAHPFRGASCGCQLPRNFGNHLATK